MSEIIQTPITSQININAHYANDAKVKRTQRQIVQAPETIPTHNLYSDKEANDRLNAINQDVYNSVKSVPVKNHKKKKFFGLF